jgi:hypothetical protein
MEALITATGETIHPEELHVIRRGLLSAIEGYCVRDWLLPGGI